MHGATEDDCVLRAGERVSAHHGASVARQRRRRMRVALEVVAAEARAGGAEVLDSRHARVDHPHVDCAVHLEGDDTLVHVEHRVAVAGVGRADGGECLGTCGAFHPLHDFRGDVETSHVQVGRVELTVGICLGDEGLGVGNRVPRVFGDGVVEARSRERGSRVGVHILHLEDGAHRVDRRCTFDADRRNLVDEGHLVPHVHVAERHVLRRHLDVGPEREAIDGDAKAVDQERIRVAVDDAELVVEQPVLQRVGGSVDLCPAVDDVRAGDEILVRVVDGIAQRGLDVVHVEGRTADRQRRGRLEMGKLVDVVLDELAGREQTQHRDVLAVDRHDVLHVQALDTVQRHGADLVTDEVDIDDRDVLVPVSVNSVVRAAANRAVLDDDVLGAVDAFTEVVWSLCRYEGLIGELDDGEESLQERMLGTLLDRVAIEVDDDVVGRYCECGEEPDPVRRRIVAGVHWPAG